MSARHTRSLWLYGLEWTTLIAIMILATFLRYWRIEEVPPGFNSDEAVGAMGALTTLRDGIQYSYEGQGGGGALGFYFAAAAFYLFGPSIATMRGLAAWASLVGLFAHYWAVREIFRTPTGSPDPQFLTHLNQARLIAMLSTLGLAVSGWHLQVSRVAFAGIGVPFLMMPSVYFLWLGINKHQVQESSPNQQRIMAKWPFIVSGIFLGGLMYIYLSGMFAPPFYAVFFIGQWLIVLAARRLGNRPWIKWQLEPPQALMTSQFWNLFATGLTAAILLLPIIFVLLTRPEIDPSATRVSQASFLNPTINGGDPWGLLWRSTTGNFRAFGISPAWLAGQVPVRLAVAPIIGFLTFAGFIIALWRGVRGQAAYLFVWLWFIILLLPSILAPDAIPHTLRAIGASNATYILAAIAIVTLFELIWWLGRQVIAPRLSPPRSIWFTRGIGLVAGLVLIVVLWQSTASQLYGYFYLFPETNDAKAAYHVYAVEMANEINRESRPDAAFILPRNTAAGDVFKNFTTEFLLELEQPPQTRYWVIDDERTLAQDLTTAAAEDSIIRVVRWKTSKHTGADPKEVIPYYLEKFGHYEASESFEYFNIHTYQLEAESPNFAAAETLTPAAVNFGGQIQLSGYGFGDAGDVTAVTKPQAHSNDLLWLRLNWQKLADHPEDLKVSVLLFTGEGSLVTQVDKALINNILQVGSRLWPVGASEDTYFLIEIPPATPPGQYSLHLSVYGSDSLARLPILSEAAHGNSLTLGDVEILPAKTPPELEDLTLALPVTQEVLPGLTLIGFETLPAEAVYTGNQVLASVIWQATGPLANALSMSLIAEPVGQAVVVELAAPIGLAGSGYPTTAWRPGELLRGWLNARIPPSLEPGKYTLSLRLTDSAGGDKRAILPIGQFEVQGWHRNFNPPTPQIVMGASFNQQARLVGLDTTSVEVTPGETLNARLYWQAEAEFDHNYTAFVQVIGPDGLLYGQMDQVPGQGAFPTTGWLSGEYLADEYAVPISGDAPPGDYQLAIGLYNPDTGERLTLSNADCQTVACTPGDDAVRLPGLVIK